MATKNYKFTYFSFTYFKGNINEPFGYLVCIASKHPKERMVSLDTGWIVSLIVAGLLMVVILAIAIPMDRKYVVRENGKINFKKTKIYLRWNVSSLEKSPS